MPPLDLPADRRSSARRAWDLPIAWHVAGLAMVLVVVAIVLGPSGELVSDEGAAVAQARSLRENASWTIPHPLPDADPAGAAFPLEKSTPGDGGFAPLGKHPAYPALLAAQPFGTAGMVAWSVLGTIAAAVVAAAFARRIDPALERWSLWVIGLASPLFFYAFLVKGHTLAAAAGGGATLLALSAVEDGRRSRLVAAATLVAVATVLRTEGLLLAGALGLVLLVVGISRRDRTALVGGVLVAATGAAAYTFDRWLSAALVGTGDVQAVVGGSAGDASVGARLAAAVRTLVRAGYSEDRAALLVLLALAAVVLAAVVVRRRPGDGVAITTLVWSAAGLLTVAAVLDPGLVPGLLTAFPLLAGGAVLAAGRRPSAFERWAWCVVVLYLVAVLATQYDDSGGTQWGARYLALVLPVAVPLGLAGLLEASRRVDEAVAWRVLPALVVVALALPLSSLRTIDEGQQRARDLVASTVAAAETTTAGDGGPPVVIATEPTLPRLAWSALEDARWLLVPDDELAGFGEGLQATEVQELVVVVPPGVDLAPPEGYGVADELDLVSGWTATVVRRVE